MGVNITEIIFLYNILRKPSFNIITQYIKSSSNVYFLNRIGKGIIAIVYIWMLLYNSVLCIINNKHEGSRFRNT